MIIIIGIIIITLWVLIVGVANIWGIPKAHRFMVVSELFPRKVEMPTAIHV